MTSDEGPEALAARFLTAWLGARQMIQAANFNRFQKAGLSATQFMTLNLIPAGESTMTLGELSRRMNLGAATLTKTLDSLEARGLLSREQSGVDRRKVLLSLTPAGRALQNAASKEFHQYMAGLFRKLKKEQRLGLAEGLEALLAASKKVDRGIRVRVTTPGAQHGDPPAKHNSRQSPAE